MTEKKEFGIGSKIVMDGTAKYLVKMHQERLLINKDLIFSLAQTNRKWNKEMWESLEELYPELAPFESTLNVADGVITVMSRKPEEKQ